MDTNQFSVTEYWSRISKGRMQMPAVFFVFDLAAIHMTIRDSRSFLHFLVRICAVIGGVFAVTGERAQLLLAQNRICSCSDANMAMIVLCTAGMLDRWIYRLMRAVSHTRSAP